MKSRRFFQSIILTFLLAGFSCAIARPSSTPKQNGEFYELRVYTFKNTDQQKLTEDYLEKAAIPALNRLGSKTIGVFTEQQPEGQTKIYVIIPYKSMEEFIGATQKLKADKQYLHAAAPYLEASAQATAYDHFESSFLKSFTGFSQIVVPEKKDRIFELRCYESPTESAGKKKISMFNDMGEIDIFKRTGLTPVFFGETLIGNKLPNLTYMLVFDDMKDHDESWGKFGKDPDWKRISALPDYTDAKIIRKITRTFLVPTRYSQI
ncbi:NIPSNAP family containing protein [Pedobacter sp. HMF7647]|uniref:NIPSNAP family containing protein n=1 Tax=Hufsiella arboris TaxID=2695275 RepID=A0A7K1YE38_9SPHI|nr:NIPSNAP family protein [Hufsiella arboris]MXV52842.1 NIPSNAP family containing protein [Hufsiella arboris]